MPDWVTREHPDHDLWTERNEYVWDLYSGAALVKARDKAEKIAQNEGLKLDDDGRFQPELYNRRPDLGTYLFRRAQGENPLAFSERARISRFPAHFAQVVDRHVGAVQLAGYDTTRWVDPDSGDGPLGDPSEPGSTAAYLKRNADGQETSWDTLMTQGIKRVFLQRRLWYLVDGPTEEVSQPRVVWLDTESVINWIKQDGRLTDVVVTEERDGRDSIQDDHETETVYIHYSLDGFQRFDGDGEPVGEMQEWDNPFWETPEQERRILPVGYVDLQLRRDVPRAMAQDQEYLFNELSDIRMAMRIAAHPKFHLNADDQAYQDTKKALLAGANLVRAESADWLSLPWDSIQAGREMYQADVKEFYDTAFQQLNDAARKKTATEIQQEDQRGRQAFLVHLSDRADELENAVRYRLAQIAAPGSPEQWDIPKVRRSNDYQPVDPDAESKALKDLYFPNQPVPASQSTRKEAAMEIAELQGIPEEDEEGLEAAIAIGGGRPSDRRIAQLQETVASAGTETER